MTTAEELIEREEAKLAKEEARKQRHLQKRQEARELQVVRWIKRKKLIKWREEPKNIELTKTFKQNFGTDAYIYHVVFQDDSTIDLKLVELVNDVGIEIFKEDT